MNKQTSQAKHMGFPRRALLAAALLALLLASCSAMAFSPEQAAVEGVQHGSGPDFTINENSIQVLQTQQAGESTLVVVYFTGSRMGRAEECLYLQETFRNRLGGWSMSSGGGGCSSGPQGEGAISIGGSISSRAGDGTGNHGISGVYGMVYDPQVTSVQVTWADGEVQSSPVVAGSYVVSRPVQMEYTLVEALDEQEQVIYENGFDIAPGKW
jgi:hypothetical protein